MIDHTNDERCGYAVKMDTRGWGCGCVRRDRCAGRPCVGREDAQATISRLQDEGYTVHIDRVGTAPMSQCVVTNVRNPQQVTQWVPYIGPGRDGDDRALILDIVAQSVSVTLDCSRR